MKWNSCNLAPLGWIPLRELLLGLLHTPALLLRLATALGLALAWWWQLPGVGTAAPFPCCSPWPSGPSTPPRYRSAPVAGCRPQLPVVPSSGSAAVALLLGRGDAIAAGATTRAAGQLQRWCNPSPPSPRLSARDRNRLPFCSNRWPRCLIACSGG